VVPTLDGQGFEPLISKSSLEGHLRCLPSTGRSLDR
jgi:hypothetical protein